jgi:YhcH/YjgK/YiaL family protein
MIADRLEQAERYRGLDPRLDRGLEALRRLADAAAAPAESSASRARAADGRHELEGEELYASLSTYETGDPAAKSFEAHRRYIDIQAVLSGREELFWAPLAGLAERRVYSPAEDLAFFADPPGGGTALTLEPGAFVVLFPQDAHKPGCRPAGEAAGLVRKLVIKVRV